MIKWLINWIASVLIMIPAGFLLGPPSELNRYLEVVFTYDMPLVAFLSLIAASIGIFLAFIIKRILIGDANFNYSMEIMISVFLSATASVPIAYIWFTIVSIT